ARVVQEGLWVNRGCTGCSRANVIALDFRSCRRGIADGNKTNLGAAKTRASIAGDHIASGRSRAADRIAVAGRDLDAAEEQVSFLHRPRRINTNEIAGNHIAARIQNNAVAVKPVDHQPADRRASPDSRDRKAVAATDPGYI